MMKHSPGIGFGYSVLLVALSAFPGAAVSLFLVITLNPLVELFPANSGAQGIALGIAVMWGLVVATTVAVYAFGSVRRARRTVAGEGTETDWESQRRYVPLAGSRIARAEPYPVYFRDEFQHEFQDAAQDADYETGAELDYRLRRMEAMMASNLRPVDYSRADYGRPGPARSGRAAPPPLTGASMRRSAEGSGALLRHAAAPAGYHGQKLRISPR